MQTFYIQEIEEEEEEYLNLPPKLPIKVNGVKGKACRNIICGWKPYYFFTADKDLCDSCIYNKKMLQINIHLNDIKTLLEPKHNPALIDYFLPLPKIETKDTIAESITAPITTYLPG